MDHDKLLAVLLLSGLEYTSVSQIANRYSLDGLSWYAVETEWGRIVIGWRKRVIVLDWAETGRTLSSDAITSSRTRCATYVHCWGYGSLVAFIGRLIDVFRRLDRDARLTAHTNLGDFGDQL